MLIKLITRTALGRVRLRLSDPTKAQAGVPLSCIGHVKFHGCIYEAARVYATPKILPFDDSLVG